jgi:hypothetical protein
MGEETVRVGDWEFKLDKFGLLKETKLAGSRTPERPLRVVIVLDFQEAPTVNFKTFAGTR